MSSLLAHRTPTRLRWWWWWLSLLVGIGLLQGQDAAGRLSFESVFVAGDASQNKVTAVVFRDGVSVSEYEGATEAAVRADAAVPTVSYVRGPDLGGGVGGLVASLR